MRRIFTFAAAAIALLSAFALYAISYQTRQIEAANQRSEREIKKLNRDIAIMRAERAFLLRPDRIEPLARELGMRPVRGDQFISRGELQSHTQRR